MRARFGPLVVLDAGSVRSSVAVAREGDLLAEVEVDRRSEEGDLLAALDRALASGGLERQDLAGVVCLRGPGSFTGLRIAGALTLGLARGLGIPSGSVSTFEALGLAAPARLGRVLAAVDAMRDEWHVQPLSLADGEWPRSLATPALVAGGCEPPWPVDAVIGFAVGRAWPAGGAPTPAVEATALAAPVAVRLSQGLGPDWRRAPVTRPYYLRAPAVGAAPRLR